MATPFGAPYQVAAQTLPAPQPGFQAPAAPPPPAAAPAAAQPQYAPVLDLAKALAAAAQLPQRQQITETQAANDASAAQQVQAIHGYTSALAQIIASIAPAVQQGYTQAANETGTLGAGFGNLLNAGQAPRQAEAANLLATSGGQAQQPLVNQATGTPALGGALGWLNGGLPAQGLEQAGAAYGAAARALPAQFAGEGLQQIGSVEANRQAQDASSAQKLSDLEAQYPGLLLKTVGQVQSQQTAAQSAADLARSREAAISGVDPLTGRPTLAARTADATTRARESAATSLSDYRQTMAKISAQRAADTAAYQNGELTVRQYSAKVNAASKAESAAEARARIAVSRYNAATSRINATTPTPHYTTVSDATGTYVVDEDTGGKRKVAGPKIAAPSSSAPTTKKINGVTYQWDADRKGWIKSTLPKDTSSGSKAGQDAAFPNLSKTQVVHLRSGIANAFYGVPEKKDVSGKVTQAALPPVDYQTAITEGVKHGYSQAGATKMANRFYKPGERGRPGGKPAPYVAPVQSPGAFGFQAVG